ncbi:YcdH [Lactobacillus phage S193]|nr:YcdH [Lactobacillus phage S193]
MKNNLSKYIKEATLEINFSGVAFFVQHLCNTVKISMFY